MKQNHFWEVNSAQTVTKLHFMTYRGSELCSQAPVTFPYPQPHEFNCDVPSYVYKIHFIITLPLMPSYIKYSFLLLFSHQWPGCILRLFHACYRFLPSHSSFYWIILMVFSKIYKWWTPQCPLFLVYCSFTFHRSMDIDIVKMQHIHDRTTAPPLHYNTQRNKIQKPTRATFLQLPSTSSLLGPDTLLSTVV